jgi:hypothetical protein
MTTWTTYGVPGGPVLSDEQFRRLAGYGEMEHVEAGQDLYASGDDSYDFFLLGTATPWRSSAAPRRSWQSVLDAANAADVDLPQSCGEGACGTCRVLVLSGTYETDTPGDVLRRRAGRGLATGLPDATHRQPGNRP